MGKKHKPILEFDFPDENVVGKYCAIMQWVEYTHRDSLTFLTPKGYMNKNNPTKFNEFSYEHSFCKNMTRHFERYLSEPAHDAQQGGDHYIPGTVFRTTRSAFVARKPTEKAKTSEFADERLIRHMNYELPAALNNLIGCEYFSSNFDILCLGRAAHKMKTGVLITQAML